MLKITFRGHTLVWTSREEAIRFYTQCLRDSELALKNTKGHEDIINESITRLESILDQIFEGKKEIADFE